MNRAESREKAIRDLLDRNIYLESLLLRTSNAGVGAIIEHPVVYVVVSKNDDVAGIFLDPAQAESAAALIDGHHVQPCDLNLPDEKFASPVIIPNQTEVTANIGGRKVDGTIEKSDNDLTLGIEKVIYHFLPKGLPATIDNCILIYHSDVLNTLP